MTQTNNDRTPIYGLTYDYVRDAVMQAEPDASEEQVQQAYNECRTSIYLNALTEAGERVIDESIAVIFPPDADGVDHGPHPPVNNDEPETEWPIYAFTTDYIRDHVQDIDPDIDDETIEKIVAACSNDPEAKYFSEIADRILNK